MAAVPTKHPHREFLGLLQLVVLSIAAVALAVIITISVAIKRTEDRWHRADQRDWAAELQQLNPQVRIPEIP